jgi:hypothetical protein
VARLDRGLDLVATWSGVDRGATQEDFCALDARVIPEGQILCVERCEAARALGGRPWFA